MSSRAVMRGVMRLAAVPRRTGTAHYYCIAESPGNVDIICWGEIYSRVHLWSCILFYEVTSLSPEGGFLVVIS